MYGSQDIVILHCSNIKSNNLNKERIFRKSDTRDFVGVICKAL
jgi:hypothetical protein